MRDRVKNPFVPGRASFQRSGFTLIELLIVITIIVVLAAFTLMLTQNIKEKAYQTNAVNTLRQVATANVSYAMDNNEDINVLLDAGDPRGAGDTVSNSFWGRLIPYLFEGANDDDQVVLKSDLQQRLDALFGTPDSKEMNKTFQARTTIYIDDSGLPVPFAFNTNLYVANQYVKSQSFRDPSQMLYMSYGYRYFDEDDGANYTPIPTGSTARTNNIDYFKNKSAAFVFLDGHIGLLNPPIAARRFKDADP